MGRNLPYMSPVIIHPDSTRKALNGEIDLDDLERMMLKACATLEKKCDFLIIEGSGHPGVGSVVNLSNARIAKSTASQSPDDHRGRRWQCDRQCLYE